MDYININWKKMNLEKMLHVLSHNKCRNPGNSKGAPWCYTKNPTKRWDYCVQADLHNFARIILIVTTLLFIVLAYATVKVIFKNELFTKFMAMMLGGKASQASYFYQFLKYLTFFIYFVFLIVFFLNGKNICNY